MGDKRKGDGDGRKPKKSRPYISSSDSEEETEEVTTKQLANSPLMNPRVVLTPPAPTSNTTSSATTSAARRKELPKPSTSGHCAGNTPNINQAGPSQATTATSNNRASSHASASSHDRPGSSHAGSSRTVPPYTVRHGVASFAGQGWVSVREGTIRVHARRIQRDLPRFQTMNFIQNVHRHHPNAEVNINWEDRAILVTGGTAELRTIDSLLSAEYMSR